MANARLSHNLFYFEVYAALALNSAPCSINPKERTIRHDWGMSLRPHLPLNIISFLTFEAAPSGVTRVFSVIYRYRTPYQSLASRGPECASVSDATPHFGFLCSFSELPNSALAFGRSCAAGKGGT